MTTVFDSQMQQGTQLWAKFMSEQLERLTTAHDELARHEGRTFEMARTAVEEYARLMKESIAYAEKLSAETRRLFLESTRRVVEAATPAA